MKGIRVNTAAPDIICVCVDGRVQGDGWGRLYHCYSEKEVLFENEYQLLKQIEGLMDAIDYPQSSVQSRCFGTAPQKKPKERVVQKVENARVINNVGEKGTFVVHVQYRQNATWQGEVMWAEKNESLKFRSALELLKLIDSALDITEKSGKKGEEDDER